MCLCNCTLKVRSDAQLEIFTCHCSIVKDSSADLGVIFKIVQNRPTVKAVCTKISKKFFCIFINTYHIKSIYKLNKNLPQKFSFSERATNICVIFQYGKCQSHKEDRTNLCGLLKKAEL